MIETGAEYRVSDPDVFEEKVGGVLWGDYRFVRVKVVTEEQVVVTGSNAQQSCGGIITLSRECVIECIEEDVFEQF